MRLTMAVVIGVMVVGALGCGGEPEPNLGTPLPVQDGTYFRYADVTPSRTGFPRSITLRLEDAGERTFRHIETLRIDVPDRPEYSEESTSPVLLLREDGVVLGFADEDLKPNALGKEQVVHRLAKVWLSRENRVPGVEVRLEGFPDSAPTSARRTWKRWEVTVVAPYGYEYYFDLDTGFLVGWTTEGGDTWVLEATNARGLRGAGY